MLNLSKKFMVLGLSAAILSACAEPFEPVVLDPAPAEKFAGEPYKFTQVKFASLPEQFQITRVRAPFDYPKGTLVVDPNARFLYVFENDDGIALRYPIAIGREGFEWSGTAVIARRSKWPDWRPTPDMLEENPDLPEVVEGGDKNPLGARALYLYDAQGRDTLIRFHGTNAPSSIGRASSSGCFRMFNEHVIDLYNRVPNGAPVVVLELGAEIGKKKPETFQEYMEYIGETVEDSISSIGAPAQEAAEEVAGEASDTVEAAAET